MIIKDKFVYWMDSISKRRQARGFKLERFDIEAGKRETVCQSEKVTINPFSMDVSDSLEVIYVSDWRNMAIWKLNLNTTENERYNNPHFRSTHS